MSAGSPQAPDPGGPDAGRQGGPDAGSQGGPDAGSQGGAEGGRPDENRAASSDFGGDPVCWAPRVCPECGLFVPGEPPTVCPRCGAGVGVD